MRSRGIALVCLIFVLCALTVTAQQQSSITPLDVYFGQEKQFDLIINNFLKTPKSEISVNLNPLTPTSVTDFISWTETIIPNTITWNGATLTDASVGTFRFKARAPIGSAEQTVTIPVTLKSTTGQTTVESIKLTLKVDNLPPTLAVNEPTDGDFVLKGTNNLPLRAIAADLESGLNKVEFGHQNCDGTGSALISTLVCDASGSCTGSADLSTYATDVKVCYSFKAYDNAGNTANVDGKLNIDGSVPLVTLNSPLDEKIVGITTEFKFTYTDNSAQPGFCNVSVDGTQIGSATPLSGAQSTVVANLDSFAEGLHDWSVICTDIVGLSTEVVEQDGFNLDSTAPVIVLVDPITGKLVGNSYAIDVDVTDNNGIASVVYSLNGITVSEGIALLTGSSSAWTEGSNKLSVTATDLAGNIKTEIFTIIVDLTAPTVKILSPISGASVDYHVIFSSSASDNLDTTLDCQITTDVADSELFEIPTGTTVNQALKLEVGSMVATLTCIDDAGNQAIDKVPFQSVDLSGPDVTFEDLSIVVRGTKTDVKVTATDYSGIDTVGAEVFGDTFFLTTDPISLNTFNGFFTPDSSLDLGTYTINYVAKDRTGSSTEISDDFELISGRKFIGTIPDQKVSVAVVVSIKVTDDRGEPTAETILGVRLYDGSEMVVDKNPGTGVFTFNFITPSELGEYTITLILEGDNGYTYEKDITGIVIAPGSSGSSATGSSSSGPTGYDRKTSTGTGFWNGPFDARVVSTPGASLPSPTAGDSGKDRGSSVSEPQSPQPRTPGTVAVGSATNVFSTGKYIKWISLLLIIGLLIGMYAYIRKMRDGKNKQGPIVNQESHDKIFGDE